MLEDGDISTVQQRLYEGQGRDLEGSDTRGGGGERSLSVPLRNKSPYPSPSHAHSNISKVGEKNKNKLTYRSCMITPLPPTNTHFKNMHYSVGYIRKTSGDTLASIPNFKKNPSDATEYMYIYRLQFQTFIGTHLLLGVSQSCNPGFLCLNSGAADSQEQICIKKYAYTCLSEMCMFVFACVFVCGLSRA